MGQFRTVRVANLIRGKIAALILEGGVKDPRVDSFLTITHVDVSKDLQYADVFVSSYKTEEGLSRGVEGLNSAAGFIQSALGSALHIRATPRLRFHADTALRDAFALNQKIDGLAQR
jgi:ribosome-binding factor A